MSFELTACTLACRRIEGLIIDSCLLSFCQWRMSSEFLLRKTLMRAITADPAIPINCLRLAGCPTAQLSIARQVIPSNNKMYVGAITTPIANHVKTWNIMAAAQRLATAADTPICKRDRLSPVKIPVSKVASKFAGTKKAQILMQYVCENSVTVLKSSISLIVGPVEYT